MWLFRIQFKGTVQEDFQPGFCHNSSLLWLLSNGLKYFRWWWRFQVIQVVLDSAGVSHRAVSYCGESLHTRAGNSLIWSSLIRSFTHFAQIKWATVRDSLRLLKTNERPWANSSGRSEEMSDREWFAQVAQRKWAMWVNRSFRSRKMSKWAICSKNFG